MEPMTADRELDHSEQPEGTSLPGWTLLRKTIVAITGVLVILVGIPLIPLIGPGWLIVFTGLAILAREFVWARRLRDRIRARWTSLLEKYGREPTE